MAERRAAPGPRPTALPAWASWSAAGAERPWTVGMEEEVMLLDPRTWSVANRIDDVLGVLPPEAASCASAETHACVIELRTTPHPTVAAAAAQLVHLRHSLAGALRDSLGLRAAVAGTHPMATRSEVEVSSTGRYREIEATMRALAHREPTMALHVHVAVPDGAAAVHALDGLRSDLPVLLALSANSPYWRASDSGFASVRTPIFSMFPRVGIPRPFGTYPEYVRAVDPLVRSDAIPDPGFLWWDARLQPRLGTVEVRIMDAQSRVMDAAALAALVQCRVRHHADAPHRGAAGPEALAENRFLAARDGMRAQLIDVRTRRRRPVHDTLTELIADCEPRAVQLGCTAELAMAAALATDPGAARQRRHAARHGLTGVAARLSDDFTSAHGTIAAAERRRIRDGPRAEITTIGMLHLG
ncbi:MAG TPA: YbdK family carboxylate-amine ligase [Solirubrobacteraceae bacterium]